MKRRSLLLATLLLAGCQGGDATKDKDATADDKPSEKPVAAPADPESTKLFMIGSAALLRVGDDWGDAEKAFPAPQGAFPMSELPDRFGKPYTARGWDASRDGFGIILYDEKIAAAMIQDEKPDTGYADELRKKYERELRSIAPVEIKSDGANYTFWEDGNQRLMLLAQRLPDKVRTTVALGDKTVMDAMGANVEKARRDGQQLDALLKELRKKGDEKPSSGSK